MPALQQHANLHNGGVHSRQASHSDQHSLIGRVEVLEEAVDVLLQAQVSCNALQVKLQTYVKTIMWLGYYQFCRPVVTALPFEAETGVECELLLLLGSCSLWHNVSLFLFPSGFEQCLAVFGCYYVCPAV